MHNSSSQSEPSWSSGDQTWGCLGAKPLPITSASPAAVSGSLSFTTISAGSPWSWCREVVPAFNTLLRHPTGGSRVLTNQYY